MAEETTRRWLLKSEPDTFSWSGQVSFGRAGAVWDGVRNHQAAKYLRAMQVGDRAFFYHTGSERRVIGIVEIVKPAFPDPSDPSKRFVSVKTRAVDLLPRPISLAELRMNVTAYPALSEMLLFRQPRLSVMPVTLDQWNAVLALAEYSESSARR